MKTIKYLTMAALALLTAACSSDDNEQAQQPTISNGMVTKYNSSTYGDNEYTTDEWQAMEAAGVVFLPAAGIVQNVSFENGNINIGRGERDCGCSVRLVYKLPE